MAARPTGSGAADRLPMTVIRVAYLLEQCWHPVPGGTAVAAVGLARALADRPDIELVGLAARHRAPPPGDLQPTVPVVHSALPRAALYEAWHRLGRPVVDRLVGWPDLVHASGGAVPATAGPLVATIYDLSWRHRPDWATRRGRRLAESWLNDARRADRVVCPSEATRRDLAVAGFDENRLTVVPLGVELCDVDPDRPAALRSARGLDGPFVLWVGTLEPRKNLPVLVQAMQQIPGVPLVVVGPTGWRADPKAILGPLGDLAHFVGPVGEADKQAWYAAADVFCYPSLLEGFGLPVAEAMARGTPVVTAAGTATEEVAAGAALVVDPADPVALADAIASVLADQGLSARLAEAGRRRAAELTWPDAARAMAEVYREALGR
ncbi:MAG: glycosyltransferase family 4 protein [Acidimicrobiales bacterium]|nr:glycosyltransferase family 4 protein [Acidimicrobiales bacterium]